MQHLDPSNNQAARERSETAGVFVCWSGPRSLNVANGLHDFLVKVVPGSTVKCSSP